MSEEVEVEDASALPVLLDKVYASEVKAPHMRWCASQDLCALSLGDSAAIMRLRTKDLTWQRIASLTPGKRITAIQWRPDGNVYMYINLEEHKWRWEGKGEGEKDGGKSFPPSPLLGLLPSLPCPLSFK